MLTKWLTYKLRPDSPYKFAVVDSTEMICPDEEIRNWLACILLEAYESPEMMRHECQLLLQDAADLKLDILRQYVEEKILPNGKNMVATRVGNFGEVLSAFMDRNVNSFWLDHGRGSRRHRLARSVDGAEH